MKVLYINSVYGIRSTGKIIKEFTEYLKSRGVESFIAYSFGLKPEKGFKIGNSLDRKIHALLSRITGLNGYFSIIPTIKLINYIDKINPDIIHLHDLHSNSINLGILFNYIAKKDIATVITLHDCWYYTGKCTHYYKDNCYKWRSICNECPRLKKDIPSYFFDRTKKMFLDKKKWFQNIPRLAVIGASDWITNEAKQSILSSATILKRIYNWVDSEIYYNENTEQLKKDLGIEKKFIILGVASQWSEQKGIKRFLELSQYLSNEYQVVLVGKVKEKKFINNKIIYIQETHNENLMRKYYSIANVLLNLSEEENCSKVTLEALMCGVPVIVTNSTGNPELINENIGLILTSLSINEIIKKIIKLKESGINYRKNCLIYANNKFNKRNNLEQYLNVYKKLMDLK